MTSERGGAGASPYFLIGGHRPTVGCGGPSGEVEAEEGEEASAQSHPAVRRKRGLQRVGVTLGQVQVAHEAESEGPTVLEALGVLGENGT